MFRKAYASLRYVCLQEVTKTTRYKQVSLVLPLEQIRKLDNFRLAFEDYLPRCDLIETIFEIVLGDKAVMDRVTAAIEAQDEETTGGEDGESAEDEPEGNPCKKDSVA